MASVIVRPGRRSDAAAMTVLVDIAAQGLAAYSWTQMAEPSQSPLEVGLSRALREEGGFSYRNALIGEVDGEIAGMMVSYRLDADGAARGDLPPIFEPLAELEGQIVGWWYINVLAVFPAYRRLGLASRLLDQADAFVAEIGVPGAGLIAASGNAPALALYARHGYRELARRKMIDYPGGSHDQDWLLLTKPLGK